VKSFVVDTHVLVWYFTRPRRLAKGARQLLALLDRGKAQAWVPAIVAAEVAVIQELGRSAFGIAELETGMSRNPGIELLPLDLQQIREFSLLHALRDPFDRLIVAAARCAKAPLLTADTVIADTGLVDVVWD
jgi:PIN domain nuclease of toxin-antitoxin system